MEHCPQCSQPLLPFRGKLICHTPGCGFMESCCDGGWLPRGSEPDRSRSVTTGEEQDHIAARRDDSCHRPK
jgi:hypothetical protein